MRVIPTMRILLVTELLLQVGVIRSCYGHVGGGSGSSDYMSSFSLGTGVGSKVRGNDFKDTMFSAAAGYLTYQDGKALISNSSLPILWNGRSYYWDSVYYVPSNEHGQKCLMPFHDIAADKEAYIQEEMPMNASKLAFVDDFPPVATSEEVNNQTKNQDGLRRLEQIVWGCRNSLEEYCCGIECCQRVRFIDETATTATRRSIAISICFIGLILICCCFFSFCTGWCSEIINCKYERPEARQRKLSSDEVLSEAIINGQTPLCSTVPEAQAKHESVTILQNKW